MPPITANLGIRIGSIGPTGSIGPFVFGSRSDRWRPSQRHDTPKGFEAISRRLSVSDTYGCEFNVTRTPKGVPASLELLARPSGCVA